MRRAALLLAAAVLLLAALAGGDAARPAPTGQGARARAQHGAERARLFGA
jgi:hypothetical protein